MGKVEKRFQQLKKQDKKAFIAYYTFGFPSPALSKDIVLTLEDAGVDIIELGIPFSDPLADGPIIQYASTQALSEGTTFEGLFYFLRRIKTRLNIPLVLMSYCNPVYNLGFKKFLKLAADEGVGGSIIVDLPVEEASSYINQARRYDIDTIFFVTPTTSPDRRGRIIKLSRGFIYYISVTGTTGPRKLSRTDVARDIAWIRHRTGRPVCVGFGIHMPTQVREFQEISDGVIVGSAIVKYIINHYKERGFLRGLKKFVRGMVCSK